MMHLHISLSKARLVFAAGFPMVLAACGGGTTGADGGASGGTAPPTSGCTTAAGCTYGATSTKLSGVGITQKFNLSLETQSRKVDYASATVSVPGNSIQFADGNINETFDVTVGDVSDPSASLIAVNDTVGDVMLNQPLVGDYEFVKSVFGNYAVNLTPIWYDGFVGLVTDVSAVPTSGVASYSGSASGEVDTGTLLPELLSGSVDLQADFGAGTVDMTVDFSLTTDGTDWVEITGMTIDGNTFSGGDLAIFEYDSIPSENNLSASNYLGDNVSHQATGVFFGVDETLALNGGGTTLGPDEVAGAVVATGDDAQLSFTFVAD